jgi:hypothetical protein
MDDERSHRSIEVAERYADGCATDEDLGEALRGADAVTGYFPAWFEKDLRVTNAATLTSFPEAFRAAWQVGRFVSDASPNVGGAIVREIFGNPFRPVKFDAAWRTDTAVALAEQMYESRDFGAMPILADALQDAGCEDEQLLGHCRGPGPHVRGCWVVDLVLGKE